MELTCFGQFRAVLDSLGQFWTVKDGLNLVLDTVRLKPSFGRPKPNPVYICSNQHWSMSLINVAIRYCPKVNINLYSDDMHADEKLGSQWKFAPHYKNEIWISNTCNKWNLKNDIVFLTKTVNPRYLSSASLDIFVLCLFYGLGRMGNRCFGLFWVEYGHNWQGILFAIYNIIFSIDQALYCKLDFIMFSECSFSVY